MSLEPPRWRAHGGGAVLQTALRAEQLGLDYLLMSDHLLASEGGANLDPLITLAAVAGATARIRLATSILALPYRHPLVVAQQAAALDVISGGRFTLGVGTGWDPAEFAALGLEVRHRGARTDEALELLRALWSGPPVTHTGRFTSFDGVVPATAPRAKGGPDIWIGGQSDAALRRALRFGDGWHGGVSTPEQVREVRERLARFGEEFYRDPGELTLSTVCFVVPPGFEPEVPLPGEPLGGPGASSGQLLDALGRLGEAGLSMVSLWLPLGPLRLVEALEWVANDLLEPLRRRFG
ncbi:LLM class flavin-dependent oxidoreductase [Kitasatospora viridis]|uniref:LLM class flavin-dependent oxidoreductase n=1 Tax=Kitasatospora viridis TaxID=281105 RepID=UPI001FEA3D3F|nr:TIGR03619 family F420-dependent LLM class oxidoreductase [Kitasatospora viridis]